MLKRLCHYNLARGKNLKIITIGKFRKLTHVFYKCEYHIVFTPKYRYRILTGLVQTFVEHDVRVISQWKEVEIEELSIQADHLHMVCSVPPKISISDTWEF